MPIEYKIFYINHYEPHLNESRTSETMIEEMNYLITTKLNEGWKCVGGVSFIDTEGNVEKICQAMTKS